MATYQVDLYSFTGETVSSGLIEVDRDGDIVQQMRTLISNFYQRPDSFVNIDPDKGTFSIGAGYWSRKGHFTLSQVQS